jgi:hypothetical protein
MSILITNFGLLLDNLNYTLVADDFITLGGCNAKHGIKNGVKIG